MLSFGQLPEGIIYREITQISGWTLTDHIKKLEDAKKVGKLMHQESDTSYALTTPGLGTEHKKLIQMSLETSIPEVEAIDLCLKLVELLELIHSKNVVHTNLCPDEIFLRNKDID